MADNCSVAMTRTVLRRITASSAIAICAGVLLTAQSIPLSEIEVTMVRAPHWRVPGTLDYTVTITGNGLVTYSGRAPKDCKTRTGEPH